MTEVRSTLEALVGPWEGVSRTWFEPTTLADESPIQGSIRRIGVSRFLLHEYTSRFGDDPREGVEIIGLPEAGKAASAVTSWVDTFHMSTDVMLSRGNPVVADGSAVANVLGSYPEDASNPESRRWGWRTEYTLDGTDQLTITAYSISPDGEELKGTEIVYRRKS